MYGRWTHSRWAAPSPGRRRPRRCPPASCAAPPAPRWFQCRSETITQGLDSSHAPSRNQHQVIQERLRKYAKWIIICTNKPHKKRKAKTASKKPTQKQFQNIFCETSRNHSTYYISEWHPDRAARRPCSTNRAVLFPGHVDCVCL